MTPRQERIAARLRSIAATATEAQEHVADIEQLGMRLDDIEEALTETIELANTLEAA